jgi:hypothetical protein
MAALAGAVLACGSAAQGAQIFFTTTATLTPTSAVTAANTNPTIILSNTTGGLTQSVFLWSRVAAPANQGEDANNPGTNFYASAERLVGMGLDVVIGPGSTHARANNFAINNNSPRWNGPPASTAAPNTAQGEFVGGAGTANANSLARFKRVAVGTDGLSGVVSALQPPPSPDGPVPDAGTGNVVGADGFIYQRFATIPLVGVADSLGLADPYFLQTNSTVVGYNPGSGTGAVNFGAGDPSVAGGTGGGGVRSALADLNVIVTIPEPASLGMVGVGALGLIRRRKA